MSRNVTQPPVKSHSSLNIHTSDSSTSECMLLVFRSQGGDSSVLALDRPGGLRALAEMLLVPAGGDVWLGAAGALKTAKITSLSHE